MVVVKVILTILFLLVCVAMVAVVMLQEGKSGGLGSALTGAAAEGTFWSKNKDRSLEGKLPKITKWLAVAFFVFAIVLNLF